MGHRLHFIRFEHGDLATLDLDTQIVMSPDQLADDLATGLT